MDANEKPTVLPKVRGRADTIRITPVRRTTVTPDAWGFHSVPGMLSDFKRHTSQRVSVTSETAISLSDRLSTMLAFGALPTAITAIYFASYSASGVSLGSGLFTTGAILGVATVCTQQQLPQTIVGCSSLVLAGMLCGPLCTPLISSLAVLSLPPTKQWKPWEWVWCAFVVLLMAYLAESVFASLPVIGLIWSQLFSVQAGQRKRTRNETLITAGAAVVCSLIGVLVFHPSPVSLFAGVVAAGSCVVFFLVGETTVASRYDSFACGIMSVFVDSILRSSLDVRVLLELVVLLPTLFGGSPAIDSESTTATSTTSSSVLDSILAHDDTRGIFYFFLLNFGFMLVQLLYSMLSHSLGLLSDSIHMFFDCLALLVGLVASILAKFPPSSRFPYGLAMVETVSGFANGCLLLAISIGVLFEAFERISNPVQLEKMTELIVVSILGLLVNLVGIFAFNHGHAHGHSHSHGHSHDDHSHEKSHHEHEHEHSHDSHSHSHGSSPSHSHTSSHSHSHSHSHGSDNLQGIFLHIVADTLGSVGVIISTLLTYIFGWSGFDAIASIVISVLIFVSAIPLVTSSAKSLLLSLSDMDEYSLRNVLNDIYTTPGVVSYTTPKFWNDGRGIRGTIHIQYAPNANSNTVREKVRASLMKGGIEQFVIQMEESGASCWCQQEN